MCCPDGEVCTDDGCCPVGRVDGSGCCPFERSCPGTCCPAGQRCDRATGRCCPVCVDGRCCAAGRACVDPGIFGGANFCCDKAANTPCGKNADGTFKACCSNANEECCATPKQLCRRSDGEHYCCPDGKVCCRAGEGGSDVCCEPDRCLAPGVCCAAGAVLQCPTTRPHCAPPTHECCGEYSCAAGTNCRRKGGRPSALLGAAARCQAGPEADASRSFLIRHEATAGVNRSASRHPYE